MKEYLSLTGWPCYPATLVSGERAAESERDTREKGISVFEMYYSSKI